MFEGSVVPPYQFPAKHWSLISQAGGEDDAGHRAALDELLRRYSPALKAHLVDWRGVDPHEADELVQRFIEHQVLERNLVAAAQPERRKFRSLLATALDQHVSDERRRRGAGRPAAEPGNTLAAAEQVATDPGAVLDVAWARKVLAETLERLQAECEVTGRRQFWKLFAGRIVEPIMSGAEPIVYRQIVADCGFNSPAEASRALFTAKRMFARVLREVISQYAADARGVEAEINDLQTILASAK